MPSREVRDFTPVPETSDCDWDCSPCRGATSDDDAGSKTPIGRILCGLALACVLVVGASCLASVYRGRAAADAALQGYMSLSRDELNPKKMEDRYDSEAVENLMKRAGRSDDINDGESMMSIDQIIEKARTGGLARQRMQDTARNTASNSTTEPPVWTEEPTPYPTQSPEEIQHVINELIMTKLNEFLSVQQTNLNAAMPSLIGPQMKHAKFPSTNKQKIDNLYGLESMYIDTMECTSVDSDLSTGSALASFRIYATTDPLTVKLRARPGSSGSFYHITMRVYGFYISSSPVGTIDFTKQSLTAVKVGWVATGCDRLDGTCYSKSNPNQKDSLCTAILNKKLRKEKAGMFRQLSSSMSSQAQKLASKITPFKLPQPTPAPAPPTAEPTTASNTSAPVVVTEL